MPNKRELAAILGYPIKQLPMKHLNTPLIERDLRVTDCKILTDQLQSIFAKWRLGKLSYVGLIQLTKWEYTTQLLVPRCSVTKGDSRQGMENHLCIHKGWSERNRLVANGKTEGKCRNRTERHKNNGCLRNYLMDY